MMHSSLPEHLTSYQYFFSYVLLELIYTTDIVVFQKNIMSLGPQESYLMHNSPHYWNLKKDIHHIL